ncbi:MAG: hypothetical protein IK095_05070 [Oscillospiraceae bacterium]|nr:hypothetical protein [Oscillospiraceae bacterium]
MIPHMIRAALSLAPDADPEQVLRELEKTLGHPAELLMHIRSVRVLVLRLEQSELEMARQVPGVRSAVEERPLDTPRPVLPRLDER